MPQFLELMWPQNNNAMELFFLIYDLKQLDNLYNFLTADWFYSDLSCISSDRVKIKHQDQVSWCSVWTSGILISPVVDTEVVTANSLLWLQGWKKTVVHEADNTQVAQHCLLKAASIFPGPIMQSLVLGLIVRIWFHIWSDQPSTDT